MTQFDFITTPQFRASLEADYKELQKCLQNQSWKAAQILAGSIVEALLIDYLTYADKKILGGKDPLKLDLAEAIQICFRNKVISERTSDLCSVVKSYRNLIHPGRQVRLDEPPPSQQSAGIASSLVDIIVSEVAKVRKGQFGFTAEQVVAKLENDHNSIALLPHFLKEVHETELERLLSTVLPSRHAVLVSQGDDEWGTLNEIRRRLSNGFRIAFAEAPEHLKKRIASSFVKILKTEEGAHVDHYAEAFFQPHDISFLEAKDQPIVKEYYLAQQPAIHNQQSASIAAALAPFIHPTEVTRWLDPFIRAIVSSKIEDSEKNEIRSALTNAQDQLASRTTEPHDKRIDMWISFLKEKQPEQAKLLTEIKADLQLSRLPF